MTDIFGRIADTLVNNPNPLSECRTRAVTRPASAATIAETWADERVRAARLTRNSVEVIKPDCGTTVHYASTAAAFKALGFPLRMSIRFRLRLKASGREVFEHCGRAYVFVLVP